HPRPAHLAPQPGVIAEDEDLVFLNRPAERSAELIARRVRNELASERIGLRLRERVTLLQSIVEVKLVPAAMQTVRARLGLHRDDAGRRLPELRVVILRGDLRFLNR